MKSRNVVLLAVVVVGCLTGAIQGRRFVGALQTSDGWSLAERAGRVVLVAGVGSQSPKTPGVESVWRISSPHLQTAGGKFLAIDETESGVRLSLSAKKTDSTRWTFDVVSSTSPKKPTAGSGDERRFLAGKSTQSFRLRLFDGPHEGWYLAAEPLKNEPDAKSKPPATVREWRITEDSKQATLFDYVDSHYFVDHK